MKAVIIDGYVDEPALLGVPPYISPCVRYSAGVFRKWGVAYDYFTIDTIRRENLWESFNNYDLLLLICGLTVPGHYVGGTPITPGEIVRIFRSNEKPLRILAGSVTLAYTMRGGSFAEILKGLEVDFLVRGDVEAFLESFFEGEPDENKRSDYNLIDEIAHLGAEIVRKHPKFPFIICEMELSKGCERSSYCSFCTEPVLHGRLKSRSVKGVLREMKELYKEGCRAFRFGRTANIFAYGSDWNHWKPCPSVLEELFSEARKIASDAIIHNDNANPSYMIEHRRETVKILETIVRYNTEGDILSFGVESFDEEVLKKNNIGSSPEIVLEAVKMVNEIGGARVNGVPKILPGINLLYGLIGESPETYRKNYEYLKKILDKGYLVRRINIRQVMIFPETPLHRYYSMRRFRMNKSLFEKWKEKIREEIDRPMLKRVFPVGTVLKRVIPEYKKGKLTFGRQLGTYPILIGFPGNFEKPVDVLIVDHGRRSITGIKYPASINSMTVEELEMIPGIGKNLSRKIILERPFKDWKDVEKVLGSNLTSHLKDLGITL